MRLITLDDVKYLPVTGSTNNGQGKWLWESS